MYIHSLYLQYFSICSFCTCISNSGIVLNWILQESQYGKGCSSSLCLLRLIGVLRSIPQISHLNLKFLCTDLIWSFKGSLPDNILPHSSHLYFPTSTSSWTVLWCLCILLRVVNTLAHTLHSVGSSGFLFEYNSFLFFWASVKSFLLSSGVLLDLLVSSLITSPFSARL